MITYLQLGKKGRLGNQLFQIASVTALAKKHGHKVAFPQWKYDQYFEDRLPTLPIGKQLTVLKEQTYAYHEWPIAEKDYDITGWLQSEQYWEGLINVKELFSFKTNFKRECRQIIGLENVFEKPVIAISIRRGDFTTNPNYYTLPSVITSMRSSSTSRTGKQNTIFCYFQTTLLTVRFILVACLTPTLQSARIFISFVYYPCAITLSFQTVRFPGGVLILVRKKDQKLLDQIICSTGIF